VRALLREAPDGPVPVVHRGPLAVYVEVLGRCVGVVTADAVAVPCALRSRIRHFPSSAAASAYVHEGVLHLDCTPLAVGRSVDVSAPRLDREAVLRTTASPVTVPAIPPAEVVGLVASAAPAGLDADAVRRLVGRGDGLTPLGDDVVCGWLATHRAAGVPTPDVDHAVRAHSGRTTLLSATLLDCALHGEVLPELGAWLAALGTPAEPRRATDLLRVGGSSGAGLLAGARLALDHLLTEGALAA
jgi:hypothetical protein